MIASELAARLMEHPNADVMMVDPDDPTDFDFVNVVVYFEEHDRFHFQTKVAMRIPAEWDRGSDR